MLKYLSVDEYCEWVTTYRDEDMTLSPVCCVCWNTCEVCILRNVGLRIFHEQNNRSCLQGRTSSKHIIFAPLICCGFITMIQQLFINSHFYHWSLGCSSLEIMTSVFVISQIIPSPGVEVAWCRFSNFLSMVTGVGWGKGLAFRVYGSGQRLWAEDAWLGWVILVTSSKDVGYGRCHLEMVSAVFSMDAMCQQFFSMAAIFP